MSARAARSQGKHLPMWTNGLVGDAAMPKERGGRKKDGRKMEENPLNRNKEPALTLLIRLHLRGSGKLWQIGSVHSRERGGSPEFLLGKRGENSPDFPKCGRATRSKRSARSRAESPG